MKGLRAALTTLGTVGASATIFLLLMMGGFWAIFVLPVAVFLLLMVVFSVMSAERPEGARRHRILFVDPDALARAPAPGQTGGAGRAADAFVYAKEGEGDSR